MLPRQALGGSCRKARDTKNPPSQCLSQGVWPGGPPTFPSSTIACPSFSGEGGLRPLVLLQIQGRAGWPWEGISGAYSQGSHGRVTEARPAMCCEGWFYKTTLSLTVLACLVSVNKDTGFSWQLSLVLFALWPSPALEESCFLPPVLHSQSPGVSLRVS